LSTFPSDARSIVLQPAVLVYPHWLAPLKLHQYQMSAEKESLFAEIKHSHPTVKVIPYFIND